VDAHIQRAFDALGWDRDTLLIVTADHGEELGDRGHFGHGATLFSEVLDVPLLVYPPGGAASGHRVSDRVSLVDVLPTLREVVGLPSAPSDAGTSLWPLVRDPGAGLNPRPLFAHLRRGERKDGREAALRACLDGRFKRIGGDPGGALLFDLRLDPGEHENLARMRPDLDKRLQGLYLDREARARSYAGETTQVGLDASDIEALRALGYVN
jgi:arylsulfatase A-like enzyme